jgi:hypothetical protein
MRGSYRPQGPRRADAATCAGALAEGQGNGTAPAETEGGAEAGVLPFADVSDAPGACTGVTSVCERLMGGEEPEAAAAADAASPHHRRSAAHTDAADSSAGAQAAEHGAAEDGGGADAGDGALDGAPHVRALAVSIPRSPALRVTGASQTPPVAAAGMVGIARNGVPIMHHHLDAASGEVREFAMAFDECGGHRGGRAVYHYHLPPLCLLKSLNGTVPARPDWWLADRPERQWPTRADASGAASPLLGWALDGFPIFGPYDPDSGALQLSRAACAAESALDNCNGKLLADGRTYAYFVTPTYPFAPPCLRGRAVGAAADEPSAGGATCPQGGYSPMGATPVHACVTLPQYMFPEESETPAWTATTALLGAGFVLLLLSAQRPALALSFDRMARADAALAAPPPAPGAPGWRAAASRLGALARSPRLGWAALVLLCLVRGALLLIDPYGMRRLLPRALTGLLYGLAYPLLNAAGVALLGAHGCLAGARAPAAAAALGTQLLVEVLMDELRAAALQPAWHALSHALYIAGGLAVSISSIISIVPAAVAARGGPPARAWLAAALLAGAAALVSACALLAGFGPAGSPEAVLLRTVQRLLEVSCSSPQRPRPSPRGAGAPSAAAPASRCR